MPSHTAAEVASSLTLSPSVRADLNRAVYECMTAEEIQAELRGAGIDPQPTINAVTALVQEKLAARNRKAAS